MHKSSLGSSSNSVMNELCDLGPITSLLYALYLHCHDEVSSRADYS